MKKKKEENSILKNIVALLCFIITISLFAYNFVKQKDLKLKAENVKTLINELNEDGGEITNDLLDSFYTENNINLSRILSADDNEMKEKIVDLLNKFRTEKIGELRGDERRYIMSLYDGTKFIGDSQVAHIKYSNAINDEYLAYMPGKTLTEQLEQIESFLSPDIKKVVLWNGFNIFSYKDSDEFIEAYQKIVDVIENYNKDIQIFVCSILPARNDALQEDLLNDAKHNLYKGPEYDEALKEYFGDRYVNLNFIVKNEFYTKDGVHFNPYFNYVLAKYMAYYTNLSFDNEKTKKAKKSLEKWRVATGSVITFGSFYNVKRDELVESDLRFKVLENDGQNITCISYEILDNIPYGKDKKCEYNDSFLRKYLIDYFYNSAFNKKEKKMLRPIYDKDLITVLSYKEYKEYVKRGLNFTTDNSMYSHKKIDKKENAYITLQGNVWLRDSYYIGYHFSADYKVRHLSDPFDKLSFGVRPVIKIDIKSYLEYVNEDNHAIQEKGDFDKFFIDYFEDKNFAKASENKIKGHGKEVYLTFDDGPSDLTLQILDILDQYDVKATFFMCNYENKQKDIVKRIIDSGHTIGIHCYNHSYDTLYTSKETFLDNIEKMRVKLKEDFNISPKYIRFPGGSANELSIKYKEGIMSELIKVMHDKGYEYFDWNITSGDANPATTVEGIKESVRKDINPFKELVILFHDAKMHENTVAALPEIIEYFINEGYSIKPIDNKTLPIHRYAVN